MLYKVKYVGVPKEYWTMNKFAVYITVSGSYRINEKYFPKHIWTRFRTTLIKFSFLLTNFFCSFVMCKRKFSFSLLFVYTTSFYKHLSVTSVNCCKGFCPAKQFRFFPRFFLFFETSGFFASPAFLIRSGGHLLLTGRTDAATFTFQINHGV
jgi:hypothetical protein